MVGERGLAERVHDLLVRVEQVAQRERDAGTARPFGLGQALLHIDEAAQAERGERGETQRATAAARRRAAVDARRALPLAGQPPANAIVAEADVELEPVRRLGTFPPFPTLSSYGGFPQ